MADVIDEMLHALTGATEDILYDAVHLLSARSASNDDLQLISLWARMWRHGKRNVHGNAHVHESSVTVTGPRLMALVLQFLWGTGPCHVWQSLPEHGHMHVK